ncbi:DUF2568 domain-containing protein [Sporolactobacillus shoreae]|uniref:DUF2568 domain-containing protein n=1 Tax=Sporolactobacillus shoreae TaxID=1465501 RepID=A0A4Z0GIR4_9BACL|nr:YrdB family protein [Sporolactobacillus shoreae]TGA95684.1 DUF2568 domain-containing protein [Sporolactobacillus shoreae]
MSFVKLILLSLAFFIELAALAAFSYWGFHLQGKIFLKWVVGIGVPAIVAVFWGVFLAPKASFPVGLPLRLLLKLIVFSASAWALYTAGQRQIALIFLITSVLIVVVTDSFKMSL